MPAHRGAAAGVNLAGAQLDRAAAHVVAQSVQPADPRRLRQGASLQRTSSQYTYTLGSFDRIKSAKRAESAEAQNARHQDTTNNG